jgi:hypothetical protein
MENWDDWGFREYGGAGKKYKVVCLRPGQERLRTMALHYRASKGEGVVVGYPPEYQQLPTVPLNYLASKGGREWFLFFFK